VTFQLDVELFVVDFGVGFNYVLENLRLAEVYCEFSQAEMVQLQRNAVAISWMAEDAKRAFDEELDRYVAEHAC
jgi:adenosine deaminase